MANKFNYLSIANDGSYYRKELMKENYVNIKFHHNSFVELYKGDESFEYKGETYILMEDYSPVYNENLDCYDYDITFKAWYYRMQDKLFKLDGDYSAEWDLTAKPSVFVDLLATSVGEIINLSNDVDNKIPFITLSFNGTNCFDALDMIVKALDPECSYYEWWSEDGEIYIGKLCSSLGGTELKIGTNIVSMSQTQSNTKKIDRLYAFGSTKNISARYGSSMIYINADTSYKDDDGTTLGYQDKDHILKPSMFLDSAKSALTIEYIKSSFSITDNDTTAKRIVTAQMTSSVTKTANARINIHDFDLTFNCPPDGEGHYEECKIIFSIIIASRDGGNQREYKIQEFFPSSEGEDETTNIPEDQLEVTLYENDPLVIKFVFDKYVKSGGKWVQNVAKFPVVGIHPSITLTAFATTTNKRVYIGKNSYGNDVYLNPNYFPVSDIRANYLSEEYYGRPSNIIKAKCPPAWFPLYQNANYHSAQITKRLTIPTNGLYIDGYICRLDRDDTEVESNGVEAQVIFDDIYPSVQGTLGSCYIKSVEEEDTNGQKTGNILNYYTFISSIIKNITTECYTDNTAKIVFKSGLLNGMEFELNLVKSDNNGTTFCIIPNDDYGCMLPNGTLYPKSTDSYTLIGIDISLYEDSTILSTARQRLLNLAIAYFNQVNSNQNIYTCKMSVDYAGSAIAFGQGITLKDINLATRVIGIQHPLDLPLADYQVICGNSQSYRRIAALENKTLSLK